MRVWETVLVILAIVSLVVLGLAKTVGSSAVAAKDIMLNGAVTRIVRPGTVFWGEPVDVDVHIDAKALPTCQKALPPMPPIYVALVIDRSGSMEPDNKLEEARNSASEFVDSIELTKEGSSVAVIAFDDTAQVLRKFSHNRRAVRLAIASIEAGGGTNIADGLRVAREQFVKASPPANTRLMVILLSDGQSDAASAIQEAEKLKALGIFVSTVALGADADINTLQQIASSESDYYQTTDASGLLDVYDNIVAGMMGKVATDVTLVEYFDNKQFFPTGATYRALPGINSITWQLPFVGQTGRSAGYFLLPYTLGWHQISTIPGKVDLTDCNGQPFTQETPTGPGVLVLPPQWLFYIFPLLGLIWLLIRLYLWLTQKKPPKTEQPYVRPPLPPKGLPEDLSDTLGDKYDWHTQIPVTDKVGHPLTMRIGGSDEKKIRIALKNQSSASVRLFIENNSKERLGSVVFSLGAREETDVVTGKQERIRRTVIGEFDVLPKNQERGVADLLLQQVEEISRQHNIQEISCACPKGLQTFFTSQGYKTRNNQTEVFKQLTENS